MACNKCSYRGYIIRHIMLDATTHKEVMPCPKCNDVSAYSDYVKRVNGGEDNRGVKIVKLSEVRSK